MNREQRRNAPAAVWLTLDQAIEARPWLATPPAADDDQLDDRRRQERRRRFLRRLVEQREVTVSRVGGRLLVDLNSVDELAERGRVDPQHSGRLRAVR